MISARQAIRVIFAGLAIALLGWFYREEIGHLLYSGESGVLVGLLDWLSEFTFNGGLAVVGLLVSLFGGYKLAIQRSSE